MIDIETLGTRPDAAVVQVAAVAFEPFNRGKVRNDVPFNEYVLVQDGEGSIDNGTLSWWLQQPGAKKLGKALADGTAKPLSIVLAELRYWPEKALGLHWGSFGAVWAKGSHFDLAILHSAYARHGQEPPWHYRAPRDLRTLFEVCGGEPQIDWTGLEPHNAVDDCIGQIMAFQSVTDRP